MTALTYFAYGSNLLSERLRRRVPSARALGPARLTGFRLRFNLRGGDDSAKCNIEPQPGGAVWGVAWSLPAAERVYLDAAESLGEAYALQTVTLDLAGHGREAFTYVGLPEQLGAEYPPYAWYKAFVLAGAHEHALPDAYLAGLARVRAAADRDTTRRALNRDIVRAALAALDDGARRAAVAEAVAELVGPLRV